MPERKPTPFCAQKTLLCRHGKGAQEKFSLLGDAETFRGFADGFEVHIARERAPLEIGQGLVPPLDERVAEEPRRRHVEIITAGDRRPFQNVGSESGVQKIHAQAIQPEARGVEVRAQSALICELSHNFMDTLCMTLYNAPIYRSSSAFVAE